MPLVFRIFVALAFAATVFLVGLYLPLSIYWFLHGDPGIPGGAALAMMGFPFGLIGALVAGLLSFLKFRRKSVESSQK